MSRPANLEIRLGVDCARKAILDLGVPLLISANSLWRHASRSWRSVKPFLGRDVALDSSGFVAMKLYGGYRWSAEEYVTLVTSLNPLWWAQMDYCCEPEIAGTPYEVHRRISLTVDGLQHCYAAASAARIAPPMPVLQGWDPADYVSGPIYDAPLPSLIGIGSVCRRPLRGPTGLMAVVDRLHSRLPPHVKIHLFGVKGTALRTVTAEFPTRAFSADSMAYSFAARMIARRTRQPASAQGMAACARHWLSRNYHQSDSQLRFSL